jgi:hypothetical protein
MRVVLLCLGLVASAWGSSFPTSQPGAEWDFLCKDGESLSGFKLKPFIDDVLAKVMCRSMGTESTQVEVSESYLAEEFVLFEGTEYKADVQEGSPSACKSGEVVTGVKSSKEGDTRKCQMQCSKLSNAKVDEAAGCHVIGPIDPLTNGATIVSKFLAREACPRDAMVSISMGSKGIALKMCSIAIDGVEYPPECSEVKEAEGMEKVDEASPVDTGAGEEGAEGTGAPDGEASGATGAPGAEDSTGDSQSSGEPAAEDSTGDAAGSDSTKKPADGEEGDGEEGDGEGEGPPEDVKPAEELPEVPEGEFTEPGEDYQTGCDKKGESMSSASVKMAKDAEGKEDMAVKCSCEETVEGEEQEAERTRITEFKPMEEMKKEDGCQGDETLGGFAGQTGEDGERLMALKCVEGSNEEVVEETRTEEEVEVTEEEVTIESDDPKKKATNCWMKKKKGKPVMVIEYAEIEYVEETKFEEDITMDMNTEEGQEMYEEITEETMTEEGGEEGGEESGGEEASGDGCICLCAEAKGGEGGEGGEEGGSKESDESKRRRKRATRRVIKKTTIRRKITRKVIRKKVSMSVEINIEEKEIDGVLSYVVSAGGMKRCEEGENGCSCECDAPAEDAPAEEEEEEVVEEKSEKKKSEKPKKKSEKKKSKKKSNKGKKKGHVSGKAGSKKKGRR